MPFSNAPVLLPITLSKKMPRVAKQERERKETAFEALEEVLRDAGRQRRPSPADGGFQAVTRAICLWREAELWEHLSTEEQVSSLETHSSWRAYRRKRDRSADVDLAKLPHYKRELASLFRAEAAAKGGSLVSDRRMKETAFEALEQVLIEAGRARRPSAVGRSSPACRRRAAMGTRCLLWVRIVMNEGLVHGWPTEELTM